MIRNIIFDLGGVLLNIDTRRTVAAFRDLGMPGLDQLFGVGHAAGIFREYETGLVSDAEFVEGIRQLLGNGVTEEAIIGAWNALLLNFPPERIELLRKLRSDYRLFLFSNTNGIHLHAFRAIFRNSFGQSEFDDHFEKAYYSHLVKLRKPDAAAYRLVLEENGLKASETLFVDDALVNVEAARSVGLEGYHVRPGHSVLDIPA